MSSNSKQNQLPIDQETEVDEAYLTALFLSFSRVFPAILNAAVDLNLFEIIAKAQSSCGSSSLSASEIASQFPNQHSELAKRLERMLPVLASYSLLTCSIRTNEDGKRERVYALSPVGQYYAFDNDGNSLGPFSTLIHRGFQQVWNDVKDAIADPDNNNHFQNVHGLLPFQYTEKDKELNQIFNNAMAHNGPLEMKMILKLYKGFEGVSTLVDVGGGVGRVLKQIISKYPSIKGINFDLPQVIQHASPLPVVTMEGVGWLSWRVLGSDDSGGGYCTMLEGIEHVGGSMFESVPEGDAILLKRVCHNWSDEECVKFLRNCHKALPKYGKVIVVDCIVPEIPNPSISSKLACDVDNVMFLIHGGKERTENEFQSLCMSSGFSKFHVACRGFSAILGVMEFYK
ncbi:Winged helix-like DNA-binding domain superfamily [Sesbania bispinosa]|nr:Winged helix-like DNA-binding domain superfamily [Sesbania bispinosa]